MLQTFNLALLGAATTSSHQIFPSTCDIVPFGVKQSPVAVRSWGFA